MRRSFAALLLAVALAGCGGDGGGTAGGVHSDEAEKQLEREVIVGLGDGQQPTEEQMREASRLIDISCEPDGDSAHDCEYDIEGFPRYHCRIPASGGKLDTKHADCEGRRGFGGVN
jgi:hypothetical protein